RFSILCWANRGAWSGGRCPPRHSRAPPCLLLRLVLQRRDDAASDDRWPLGGGAVGIGEQEEFPRQRYSHARSLHLKRRGNVQRLKLRLSGAEEDAIRRVGPLGVLCAKVPLGARQ